MIRGKEAMNALMTVAMMFVLNAIKTTGDCPRSCECKWKSGKESVLCVDANMTEIPRHLDSGTQVLDLTGNRLARIGADEFFNASLLNLQKVFLSRCRLRFIDRCSFRKIINLVELDLSHNDLHSVPSHTFEFINELRELRLNGNPIVRVLNHAFRTVPRLTKLDLSECRIGYVEVKAFQGLEASLEWLKLDKNKITNIKPQALVNLGNLHGLELSGNSWNCSCGLRALREWMVRRNVPYGVPPLCKHPPRLSGKIWDKLDLDEFACAPRIEAVAARRAGEEGGNVTASCSVEGVPEPAVRWLRKNHAVGNATGTSPGGRQKAYVVRTDGRTSELTVLGADAQDSGVYVCRAENKAGRAEANVTLTVVPRPAAGIWSSRMAVAVGVVSLLFATALGLLTYCAWSLRNRKSYFRHPVTRREIVDGYEMNHKKPIGYDKIVDYGNHCSIPGRNARTDGFRSRASDVTDKEKSRPGEFPSRGGPGRREEEEDAAAEAAWRTSLRASELEDGLSESSNSRLSPELNVSGSKGNNGRRNSSVVVTEEPYADDSPSGFLGSALDGDYPRPKKPRESSTLYAPALPETRNRFPDLLELSRNEENLINNNSFSLPRKRSYKPKRSRHGSFGSESQSPLLPGSSGDSCDSNHSLCGGPPKNASLPTSPGNLSQTPILNILEGSSDVFARSPTSLKYKSWELEKFLKEYRSLQDQLYKMKEFCENLKEDGSTSGEGGDGSATVESATISKNVPPTYPEEPYFEVSQKFLEETTDFASLYAGSGFLEEDNNNPKSILKKSSEKKAGFWSPGPQYIKTNPGGAFYPS